MRFASIAVFCGVLCFFPPVPPAQLASSEVGHFNLHSSVHDSFKENSCPESINYFCSIFVVFPLADPHLLLPGGFPFFFLTTTAPLIFVTHTQR